MRGSFGGRQRVVGKANAVGFALREPSDWNGRLLCRGGGALNDVLTPEIGEDVSSGSTARVAQLDDLAVASTDSGHKGQDSQGRSQASAERIGFEREARSAWHAHPFGQRLTVTEGVGWTH